MTDFFTSSRQGRSGERRYGSARRSRHADTFLPDCVRIPRKGEFRAQIAIPKPLGENKNASTGFLERRIFRERDFHTVCGERGYLLGAGRSHLPDTFL